MPKNCLLKSVLLSLCVSVFVSAGCQQPKTAFHRILEDYNNASSGTVLVVAHRGAHRDHPENSLSAIHAAIDMGVDIVEIDIRKTKDGHLILMHDTTVDRTTNGSGRVDRMTLEQIRQLRLKMPDGTLSDEGAPTLEEAMLAVKGKCIVNLDKVDNIFAECAEVLIRTGTVDHALLKCSRAPEAVEKSLATFPEGYIYMPVVSDRTTRSQDSPEAAFKRYKEVLEVLRPQAVEIVFDYEDTPLISPEAIAMARERNVRLWVNSLWASLAAGRVDKEALTDPDGHWGWLIGKGASIIQTDEPEALLEYLRARGWRR